MPQAGPPTGKAIQIQLSADDPTGLNEVAQQVADRLASVPDVIDISDGLPPPGVDWELQVDRAAAAHYGIAPVDRRGDGAAGDRRAEAVGLPPGRGR